MVTCVKVTALSYRRCVGREAAAGQPWAAGQGEAVFLSWLLAVRTQAEGHTTDGAPSHSAQEEL